MLTDAACRAARPKDKGYKLADDRGLYLFVTPAGAKSWRWKYRYLKKEKTLTFGLYPEIKLLEARQMRDEARQLLRTGVDPALDRKQKSAARALDAQNIFKVIAQEWLENQRPIWTPTHAADVERSLERDVFPTLGNLPITSITVPQVLQVIRAIEARPAVETARRVRQRIEGVFASAIAAGITTNNPAAVITTDALKPLKKRRQPAIVRLADARELLAAVEKEPSNPQTKLASRLLALTAVRPGVLRYAEPREFEDLMGEAPLWRIPAEKMKLELEQKEDEAFEFIVPLARQAADLVQAALKLIGRGPYLFPNTRHAHRPMSENAIGYMYNRHGYRGRHVPHGWRSTFSTIMNERAVALERPGDRAVIDLMLAHKPPGVEGIYNRAAYMPRRRKIAQEWADMLLDGFPPASALTDGPRR